MPTSTLVIATYNWPSALRLCLESVQRQAEMPDEVIVADDGSGVETLRVIEEYREKLQVPLKHVWQQDKGYQLAQIRNKAFAKAESDYIIQVDGDLILHPLFVKDHLGAAARNCFISGSRAMLNEATTRQLLETQDIASIPKRGMEKKYNAVRNHLLSGLMRTAQRGSKNVHFVLGCNMAFWKNDLLKVNGYNEVFSGWGKEDNDIAARLINAGVRLRFLKFGGVVYHLHHPQSARPTLAINESLFQQSLHGKVSYVPKGMDQYAGKV